LWCGAKGAGIVRILARFPPATSRGRIKVETRINCCRSEPPSELDSHNSSLTARASAFPLHQLASFESAGHSGLQDSTVTFIRTARSVFAPSVRLGPSHDADIAIYSGCHGRSPRRPAILLRPIYPIERPSPCAWRTGSPSCS
jgi:hypothetical protein